MIPRMIAGHTHRMTAPARERAEGEPHIRDLHVREIDGAFASAWEPTPDELAILNAGGSVVLWVMGGQPPVMLTAEPSIESNG